MAERILLYVGTYTRPAPYLKTTNGQGIYVYSVNPSSGELTYLSETQGIDSPSFLTIDSQKRHLYATSEVWGWQEGLVSAYSINTDTGALTYLNVQPTLGGITAYATVDRTNRYVLLVNFWNGKSAVMYPINADGSLSPASSSVQHEGVDPAHPSHAHCIVVDPTNTYAYVADLGLDKIMIYKLDLEHGKLVPNAVPSLSLEHEAGPRHFVFHPGGKYVYLMEEHSATISALSYDSATGKLTSLQRIDTLPADYKGQRQAADIQVTPDGQFLYGSNRHHNSIVIYRIDQNTGKLTYVGNQNTKGETPRNFAIDATGTFLLAANQDSDTIVTFRINHQTGQLEDTGLVAKVPTPVCLKMIQV